MSEFTKRIQDGTISVSISEKPTGNKYHRYGSLKKFDALVDSKRVEDRLKALEMGYGLDKLADDVSPTVQKALLKRIA